MENDLISREAAIAQIERRKPLLVGGKTVAVDTFIKFLKNRPAVDAELVRHGRWMPYYEPMECFVDVYLNTEIKDVQVGWICSECGRHEQHSTTEEMPYCHCGAKMDAEVKT